MAKKTRSRAGPKSVREARAEYRAEPEATDPADSRWIPLMESRLSGKNQITIPVRMTRLLDWRPGDRISLMIDRGTILIARLPREDEDWFDSLRVRNSEWGSKEAIEAWVRKEHDSWDREWDPD